MGWVEYPVVASTNLHMALQGFPGERRFVIAAIAAGERPEEHEISTKPELVNVPCRCEKWPNGLLIVLLDGEPLSWGYRVEIRLEPPGCVHNAMDIQDLPAVRVVLVID